VSEREGVGEKEVEMERQTGGRGQREDVQLYSVGYLRGHPTIGILN